jgi:hypothetical protein
VGDFHHDKALALHRRDPHTLPPALGRGGSRVSRRSDGGDKIAPWLLYLAARFLGPPPERL